MLDILKSLCYQLTTISISNQIVFKIYESMCKKTYIKNEPMKKNICVNTDPGFLHIYSYL